VGAAKLADEPDLGGIATQHYTFNATSLSLPEGTIANGEVWIAKNGGYVVKYMLEITGADAFFGKGIQGTRQVEYSLSGVGANPEVVYPTGCEPVLADMPATEDASDVTRLPGLLEYSTNAATADILTFYTNQLTTLGWEEVSGLGPDSGLWAFTRTDTGAVALVAVDTEGSSRRVTVMAPQQGQASASPTSAAATPNPNITPTSGPTADTSSLDLPKGLTVYPGATSLDTSGLTSGMAGSKYIIFHTSASPAQVIGYYDQTLEQAGWTAMPVATPSAASDHAMGMWYMGKYTLTISSSTKSGDTQVQVGWLGG
jgi:hypothetical protein